MEPERQDLGGLEVVAAAVRASGSTSVHWRWRLLRASCILRHAAMELVELVAIGVSSVLNWFMASL